MKVRLFTAAHLFSRPKLQLLVWRLYLSSKFLPSAWIIILLLCAFKEEANSLRGKVMHNIRTTSLQFYDLWELGLSSPSCRGCSLIPLNACLFLFYTISIIVLSGKAKLLSCSIINQSGILSSLLTIFYNMFIITLIWPMRKWGLKTVM